jgi:23S rRNA (guanosine2251-2'-O)-methyltransferase
MSSLILIAHDIRSTHNVGSLLRTAEGLGIEKVYLTGYTPYPKMKGDERLPHIANKLDTAINKTALGAEHMVPWEQADEVFTVLSQLKAKGYVICALEQTSDAVPLPKFAAPEKCALLVGNEVNGIPKEVIADCNVTLVIPMKGRKESFNVVQAAAMALYHLSLCA